MKSWLSKGTVLIWVLLAGAVAGCVGESVGGGRLLVEPSSLSFTASLGEAELQSLTLTNVGTEHIEVANLRVLGEINDLRVVAPALPIVLAPGGRTAVEVIFEPGDCEFEQSSVVVETKNAVSRETNVPLVTPILSGHLVISPTEVDFGEVPVGTSESLLVTIANRGTCSITLSDVYLAGANAFRLLGEHAEGVDRWEPPFQVTLLPDELLTFEVVFEPSGDGCAEGLIGVRTDNAAMREGVQAIYGCGIR